MKPPSERHILASLVCFCLLGGCKARASSNPHYTTWAWGDRLQARTPYNLDYEDYAEKQPTNSANSAYYPFKEVDIPVQAPPLIRPDGTTKSRVPQDTLPRDDESHFEGGFTSLATHLKEQLKKSPQRNAQTNNIGDLDPREVYYADDDLLIIKGGGFPTPTYEEPLQEVRRESFYRPSLLQTFRSPGRAPPSPHNEYNGNIPTIVKPPPTYWRNPVAASHYPPFALFVPAKIFAGSSSSYYHLYVPYIPPLPYNFIIPPGSTPYFSRWQQAKPGPAQIIANRPHKPATDPQNVISLVGDTDVNYLNPRPSIDSDAEFIQAVSKPYREKSYYGSSSYNPIYKKSRRPNL